VPFTHRHLEATLLLCLLALAPAGCGGSDGSSGANEANAGHDPTRPLMEASALEAQVAKFAPATLDFDSDLLDPNQKRIVRKLVEASDHLHQAFLMQVWRGNLDLADRLAAAPENEAEAAARRYFNIMAGPWDRLESDAPFLDVGPKPKGAGFYPEDMTKAEFNAWVEAHPDQRDALTGYYTVIERDGDDLKAVPYSQVYAAHLKPAARLLREASELAENPSLKKFLELRAASLLSDDYFDSEVAWMRLKDNLIEPTIGPYEVYEDGLFGYKTAFESFITLKDPEASAQLAGLVKHLPELERALPIPDKHKYLDRTFTSPISVVSEIYAAGDTRAGVQTIAFNLPNDPRVREQEGSKKVMLRNVTQAKFDQIVRPIAETVMAPEQAQHVAFDAYFTRVLMHELAHSLGPDYVTGKPDLTVNKALQDRYSAIEEAKADAVGTHNLRVLAGRGVYTKAFLNQVFIGHVADMFRCVRFGATEAHGKGCLTQFNYLREKGAISYDPTSGTFAAVLEKMPDAMSDLAHEYLMLEATGDYAGAGAFLDKYGVMSPEMQAALDRLAGRVPVDIEPHYAVKDKMADW